MRTKIILLFSLLLATLTANAQFSAVEYNSEDFNQFKGSKTYVVLTGDSKYDTEIQSAITDVWKITPYGFINEKEFETKISDKSLSFLILVDVAIGSYGQVYNFLALINGGKKGLFHYKYNDMLAYCPINHYQNEPKDVDCAYRVRNMIESMLLSIDIVQKNDIKGNTFSIVGQLQEEFNKKAKNIPSRTLLICEDAIGKKLTKSDIAGIYPYKFEMCNKEKIEAVIKEKSKDYYYYQTAVTVNKSMFVFDPSNGEVLFFDYTWGGLDVKKKQIEYMVEVIKGK